MGLSLTLLWPLYNIQNFNCHSATAYMESQQIDSCGMHHCCAGNKCSAASVEDLPQKFGLLLGIFVLRNVSAV